MCVSDRQAVQTKQHLNKDSKYQKDVVLSIRIVLIKMKFEQPELKSTVSLALYQKIILRDLQPSKYGCWKAHVENYDYEIGNAIII